MILVLHPCLFGALHMGHIRLVLNEQGPITPDAAVLHKPELLS